jgi:ribose 5-phosphate isomerase B
MSNPKASLSRRTLLGRMTAAVAAGSHELHAGVPSPTGAAEKRVFRLAVGNDHAGFPMKAPLLQTLRSWGHTVKDLGCYSSEPVDFPDIATLVCGEILGGRADRGIMICGTGAGAVIAGNKFRGIRAALCHDTFSAHQCVEHDDVNLLCMGAWIIGVKTAEEVLQAFLNARFSGEEEFRRRLRKVEEIEKLPPKAVR